MYWPLLNVFRKFWIWARRFLLFGGTFINRKKGLKICAHIYIYVDFFICILIYSHLHKTHISVYTFASIYVCD